MLLSPNDIDELYATSIASHLVNQRDALLAKVNQHFQASLRHAPMANAQLLLDLNRLNETPELTDGSVPLEQWLSQAVLMTLGSPHQAIYQRALDTVRARSRAEGRAPGHQKGGAGPFKPPPRRRPHFLDEAPLNFARPETQALAALLEENIYDKDDIIGLLDRAAIRKSRIPLDRPSRTLWHDALSAAAAQDAARRLVQTIAADPEWSMLRGRLEELLGNNPPGEAGPGKVDWKAPTKASGNERLVGEKATWVDVHFLLKGADCARSVVRLKASFGDASLLGTGFFIAPGIVLTNYHILFDEETGTEADQIELWLDFEALPNGAIRSPKVVVIAAPVIKGDAKLDWATFEVDDPAVKDRRGLVLGSKTAVARGDYVNIIQHPHGLPKKLGIFRNEVRYVGRNIMQYSTDTATGSSGSPVLNARWEVVALHRRWAEVDEPDGVQEIRNEGVVIDRVVEALHAKGVLSSSAPEASHSL
jgi:V8-like Glu-specific endopeptidase